MNSKLMKLTLSFDLQYQIKKRDENHPKLSKLTKCFRQKKVQNKESVNAISG